MNQAQTHKFAVAAKLANSIKALAPLAINKESPARSGDWLSEHYEAGQTFERYINSLPPCATTERNKIYIVPLGDFNNDQYHIICVAEFMTAFFDLDVIEHPQVSLSSVTPKAQRIHPQWGDHQISTTWILKKMEEGLPHDAAAYLCFTTTDLWPGRKNWNFVFGQASLKKRVGVWSMYRYAHSSNLIETNNKEKEQQARLLLLRRVLKTAVHETSHMFGFLHCTAFSCGMCGVNNLLEADRLPMYFCPQCTPKIAWATGVDLIERAKKLHNLCSKWGLVTEATYYAQSYDLLLCSKK